MVATCLLRYLGYDPEEAHNLIKQARELTGKRLYQSPYHYINTIIARDVGEHRVAMGKIFVDIFGTINSPKSSEETTVLLQKYDTLIGDIMESKKLQDMRAKELKKKAGTVDQQN